MASRLVVAALGWAGTVMIVRNLSASEWGQFSFIFGFLGLLSVITDLGVGRLVIAGLPTAPPTVGTWPAPTWCSGPPSA